MPPVNEFVGYWGEPTATIDWCENNYEFNFYIAEMTNTVSNLMMIIPPIWGMIDVIRQKFERKFVYCYFLILIVGLGSWAFHMTLLYEMQLFDELPMVWGTSVLVYCLSEVQKPIKNKPISNVPLFFFLTSFCVFFTILYLYWPQPLFQHTSYGLLVLASYMLEIQLILTKGCRICKRLFVHSTSIYLFGFFLWNLDKVFCPELNNLRNNIPKLLDPVTQLHGWWHIMAGYGTYLQVLFTCAISNVSLLIIGPTGLVLLLFFDILSSPFWTCHVCLFPCLSIRSGPTFPEGCHPSANVPIVY